MFSCLFVFRLSSLPPLAQIQFLSIFSFFIAVLLIFGIWLILVEISRWSVKFRPMSVRLQTQKSVKCQSSFNTSRDENVQMLAIFLLKIDEKSSKFVTQMCWINLNYRVRRGAGEIKFDRSRLDFFNELLVAKFGFYTILEIGPVFVRSF